MVKPTINLGSHAQLQRLATLIIERSFPTDTDMTTEKLVKTLEVKIDEIMEGRI